VPIATQWRPVIKANLAVTLRLADWVAEFQPPDEADPPVFEA